MKLRSAFLFQVLGAVVPALVMLLSIPLIRDELDPYQFAAFTVVISAVSLLAVMDGGLGRASTYFVSLAMQGGKPRRVTDSFHGVFLVGQTFALLIAILSFLLLGALPGESIAAARPSLMILTCFAPFFVASSLLRGFLEAQHRFGQSSALQLVHGTVIGLAPVFLFCLPTDLSTFAWAVGLCRIALVAGQLNACQLLKRSEWAFSPRSLAQARRVLGYSKWLFLSNLIGLAIVFSDRFFVATFFSAAMVTAYVLPMELVARVQVLITAFCSVVFPRLVTRPGGRPERIGLLSQAQGFTMASTVAIGYLGLFAAEPLMRWWLGEALAAEAARVVIFGIVGVGLIASAALAMLDLNSRGLTRPVAVLHAMQLPIYITCVFAAVRHSSVDLLLIVWVGRLLVDVVGMSVLAAKSNAQSPRPIPMKPQMALQWAILVSSAASLAYLAAAHEPLPLGAAAILQAVGAVAALLAVRSFARKLSASLRRSA